MEIQRALVITGIAVVSYLMIQAWQRDYANPEAPAPVEQVADSQSDAADLPTPQAETDSSVPSVQPDDTAKVQVADEKATPVTDSAAGFR